MQIHQITTPQTKKKPQRGRGGKRGTYSGRGMNGQKARSGGNVDPLFEGGRSSLIGRMKKNRGFTSRNMPKRVISLTVIDQLFAEGDTVTLDALIASKMIRKSQRAGGAKIVGTGEINTKVTISPEVLVTQTAKAAIEAVGGTINAPEVVPAKK